MLVKNVAVEVENYTCYWISFNATYKAYGEIHSITKIKQFLPKIKYKRIGTLGMSKDTEF